MMRGVGAALLRRAVLLVAAAMLGLLVWTGVASAASFMVTTTNDSNDGACTVALCSLRDAVVAADAAGTVSTITVPAGTYKLTIASAGADDPTTGDLDINDNASITINGAGSGSTIIDANQIDRAFAVQKGAGLTLSGVTIEHGNPSAKSSGSQQGGAIYSDGALTLAGDVTVRDNRAPSGEFGGAIFTDNDQTMLKINGATFEDNVNGSAGGALALDTCTNEATVQQSITDSSFISNNASGTNGGAMYVVCGNLTVSGSTFADNSATDAPGGAIWEGTRETLTLTNDTFVGNTAGFGGAIAANGCNLVASGDTFSNNSAFAGGAIDGELNSCGIGLSLFNDTFDHNRAFDGGALKNDDSFGVRWSLSNNTLAHNQATDAGGGIYNPGTVGSGSTFANNIVAENVGGDCSGGPVGTTFDAGNNLDSDGTCFATGGTGTTPESPGDLVSTNPDLGQLADNGGPTETDALLPGSPAIDTGNDAVCKTLNAPNPPTDQRGVPRPQGAHCDIGAFEAAAAHLSASNSAPASGMTGIPFTYTIAVTASGPGPSTGTTVTDQLPTGETLYGATPSQGSCSASGSPAKVTCALGTINASQNATVMLLVAEANPGSVSDTATATNDEGASVSASATTQLASPATTIVVSPASSVSAPAAITGGHSDVTKHSAKVSGTVSTGGQRTWYFFQFGRTRSLGHTSGLFQLSSSGKVAVTIRRLLAGKKHFFRLVAVNTSGSSYGAKHSFRTKHQNT
jgi:CSLREA domain-containing protein/uncharacterized repeat protein (TIGR01451 family)